MPFQGFTKIFLVISPFPYIFGMPTPLEAIFSHALPPSPNPTSTHIWNEGSPGGIGLLPFCIPFPNSLHNRREIPVFQISVRLVPRTEVDHFQRWSRIFRQEETEMNLSIWLPTSGILALAKWKAPAVFMRRYTAAFPVFFYFCQLSVLLNYQILVAASEVRQRGIS